MTVLDQVDRISNATPTAQVLCQVLKIATDNPHRSEFLVFGKFGRVIDLAEQEANKHLGFMWDTIRPHFAAIRTCFVPSFSATPWNERKTQLTQGDMTGLRHTAKHLENYVTENELRDEDTAELRKAIDEMKAALDIEAGISPYTREVLRERLRAIEDALEEYRFWGVGGLEDVFRSLAGTFSTDAVVQEDLKKVREHESTFWPKTMAVVVALNAIIGLANTSVDLGAKVLPTIEHLILPAPPKATAPETPSTVHLKSV